MQFASKAKDDVLKMHSVNFEQNRESMWSWIKDLIWLLFRFFFFARVSLYGTTTDLAY